MAPRAPSTAKIKIEKNWDSNRRRRIRVTRVLKTIVNEEYVGGGPMAWVTKNETCVRSNWNIN